MKLSKLTKYNKGKELFIEDKQGRYINKGVIKTLGKKWITTDSGRLVIDETSCFVRTYVNPNRQNITKECKETNKAIDALYKKYNPIIIKTKFGEIRFTLGFDESVYIDSVSGTITQKVAEIFSEIFTSTSEAKNIINTLLFEDLWELEDLPVSKKIIKDANEEYKKIMDKFIKIIITKGYNKDQALDKLNETQYG